MTASNVLKKSFIAKPSLIYSIQADEKVKWGSLEAGERSTGRRVLSPISPSVLAHHPPSGGPIRFERWGARSVPPVNRAFALFFAHRNYSGSQKSEFRRQNENAGDEI